MATYNLALVFVFGGLGLTALSVYFFLSLRKQERLQKIRKMPFKEEHRVYLRKTPHYKNLSAEDKEKIERSILLFVHTKDFIGISLNVTAEMKVIIAFYACLLILHIDTQSCYESLKSIIIYSQPVAISKIQNNGGIFSHEQFFIEGQSSHDTVVIIWDEARNEAYQLRQSNVIIHEFTHIIDFMDGEIDGVPPIEMSKYNEWSRVLNSEFDKLNEVALKNRNLGKYELLGAYASTNEAEFFAVATERFFGSPESLKENFAELYHELENFYKIDPLKLIV
ncbi:MAG TPA: M90 family metallopeptidase [Sulfurimonas sp.]|uniref:M90 family metallopeptidase n=1 Tax=Sulfurimonas sp. TaxID=2022749 RepID=UPI002B7C2C0A|nr:M90 family metallopeptidase [Sulfurimonas sp.]HUH42461.1 M90 family metallopeptidase [Sulfurimonas sp.]